MVPTGMGFWIRTAGPGSLAELLATVRGEVERRGADRPCSRTGLLLAEGCLRGGGPPAPGPLGDPRAREALLQDLAALLRAQGLALQWAAVAGPGAGWAVGGIFAGIALLGGLRLVSEWW